MTLKRAQFKVKPRVNLKSKFAFPTITLKKGLIILLVTSVVVGIIIIGLYFGGVLTPKPGPKPTSPGPTTPGPKPTPTPPSGPLPTLCPDSNKICGAPLASNCNKDKPSSGTPAPDFQQYFRSGEASITYYGAENCGAGTCDANFGTDVGAFGGKIDAGVAIPYKFFSGAPRLNAGDVSPYCKGGVSCGAGTFPVDKDGEPLCFELSSSQTNKKANVMVTETCGGNCPAKIPSSNPKGVCGNNSQDCGNLINGKYKDQDYGFSEESRCAVAQECSKWMNKPPGDDRKVNSAYGLSCDGTRGDWCSGYYMHFDIGSTQDGVFGKLCKDPGQGFCKVNYTRVKCPAEAKKGPQCPNGCPATAYNNGKKPCDQRKAQKQLPNGEYCCCPWNNTYDPSTGKCNKPPPLTQKNITKHP